MQDKQKYGIIIQDYFLKRTVSFMNKEQFLAKINENLRIDGRTDISHAAPKQLHNALSRAVMDDIIPMWDLSLIHI